MNSKKLLFILILILFIILYLIIFYPIKFSINKKDLIDSKSYILVNMQSVTGFEWVIEEDKSGISNKGDYIRLEGNFPKGFNHNFEISDNTFVLYGMYSGKGDFYGYKYKVFNVSDWDIIYPIKHKYFFNFIYPKKYITKFDYINDMEE